MKLLTTSKEFIVGKHNIGYVDSNFLNRVESKEFEAGFVMPTHQVLAERMVDADIESKLRPGFCTLGDVLALLDSSDETFRDGYANIFYFGACVVSVRWYSYDRYWSVNAWRRDGSRWGAGDRVFSPASDRGAEASKTQDLDLESLNARVKKLEALINPELLK